VFLQSGNIAVIKTTSHRVVVPFYAYAAISFLIATVLLFSSVTAFTNHYFHPKVLAVTHLMALGFATMIILGASHQLIPVLIEGKLYSNKLAYCSFVLAGIGIPLLVYGFYVFNMGAPAKWGGGLVVVSILCYTINLGKSISAGKSENVHVIFVFTAAVWLFITTLIGLSLVYNFTLNMLPHDSVHYLSYHAHIGIVGWLLMLVIGVSSRLIPMFLISKYTNPRLLWLLYFLINTSLIGFILLFIFGNNQTHFFVPVFALLAGILLFVYYCYACLKERIRKRVDEQMKISLLSVAMLLLPALVLLVIVAFLAATTAQHITLIVTYGFVIFFGWLTAIILGMTFKTLPFVVWNKAYHQQSGIGKTPNPKSLFNETYFNWMGFAYLGGFGLFTTGILLSTTILLKTGAMLLVLTAVLYNLNVFQVIFHQPKNE
jgi:hypothetical protein